MDVFVVVGKMGGKTADPSTPSLDMVTLAWTGVVTQKFIAYSCLFIN